MFFAIALDQFLPFFASFITHGTLFHFFCYFHKMYECSHCAAIMGYVLFRYCETSQLSCVAVLAEIALFVFCFHEDANGLLAALCGLKSERAFRNY